MEENDKAPYLDEKQITPVSQGAGVNMEHSKGEQTRECRGYALSGVKDGETSGEFASAVEAWTGISMPYLVAFKDRHLLTLSDSI